MVLGCAKVKLKAQHRNNWEGHSSPQRTANVSQTFQIVTFTLIIIVLNEVSSRGQK